MAVARRIEGKYSKDEILTAYLNRIYFGQQCYGIAQAADLYFGKKVGDLTLAECATLAGLVRGPSIYNPVSSPGGRRQGAQWPRWNACLNANSSPKSKCGRHPRNR